jgi:hypothetical protein
MSLERISNSDSQKPNLILKTGIDNSSNIFNFEPLIFQLLVKGSGSPFKKSCQSTSIRSNLNPNND